MPAREGTYGLLAEFDTPSDLVSAAQQARHDGWRRMDCYTPYPVEEAAEAIGFHRNKVPLITLIGGLMGAGGDVLAGDMDLGAGVSAEYCADGPLYSWPAFIVPAYEWTILWAGLSAAFGMLALNGLPALYHPLFNAPNFRNGATTDKFFLCLEALDPEVRPGGNAELIWRVSSRFRWWRWSTDEPASKSGIRCHWQQVHGAIVAADLQALAALLLLVAGCRQDMQNQPKLIPQRGSEMFADHRGARPQVVNTVARGQLHEDSYFYTGVVQGANGYREEQNLMPFPVTHGCAEARAGTVQYVLHAVPLAGGQRAGRDCGSRL